MHSFSSQLRLSPYLKTEAPEKSVQTSMRVFFVGPDQLLELNGHKFFSPHYSGQQLAGPHAERGRVVGVPRRGMQALALPVDQEKSGAVSAEN